MRTRILALVTAAVASMTVLAGTASAARQT